MKHMLKNKNTEKLKNTEKTFFRKIKVGLLPSKTIVLFASMKSL